MNQLKLSDIELEKRINSFLERKLSTPADRQEVQKRQFDRGYKKVPTWKQYAL